MTSFYSEEELAQLGLKKYGKNVLISRHASIYGAGNIEIGNNVRIDDFCILSGKIKIGNYIHIAAYTGLYAGDAGIELSDFANISSRCCFYAESDDYSGETMTNPMIPDEYKNLTKGKITVGRHAIVGTNCTVLPSASIGEGVAVGSMSFVNKPLEAWGIYAGVPARRLKERSKNLLELEKKFLESVQ